MLIAALAALAGALLQSATGFGFALIAAPALLAVVSPGEAIGALLVLGAVLSGLVLFGERRRRSIRRGELGPVLAAAVPGLVAGALVLRAVPKATLQVLVGAAVVVAVAVQARGARGRSAAQATAAPPHAAACGPAGRAAAIGAGLLTGLMTTSTGISGPPLVLLLEARGARPGEMRDTLAASFLALNVLGLAAIPFFVAPDVATGRLAALAALVGLVVAGHALGRLVFARIDGRRYRPAVMAVALAAGLASVAAGLSG